MPPTPEFRRISSVEALVLELLIGTPGESYGYDLVVCSKGNLRLGTVYVTLARMEDKGLVASRKEEPRARARGRPRRLYTATAIGQRAYAAWVAGRAREEEVWQWNHATT